MPGNNKIPKYISSLPSSMIPCLISAASVLRKERILRSTLLFCKNNKIGKSKIYESLLQTYLFAGFPSALQSLQIYSEYFLIDEDNNQNVSITDLRNAGLITNKKIYGEKQKKLLSNISKFSPELSDWLLVEGYGKVLSRNGLSLIERELSIITVLSALKFDLQLYSHINGAYKLGASINDITLAIKILDKIGEKELNKFGLQVLRKFKMKKGIT